MNSSKKRKTLRIGIKSILVVLFSIYILVHCSTSRILSKVVHPSELPLSLPHTTTSRQATNILQDFNEALLVSPTLPKYTRELAAISIRPSPWTCGDKYDSATDPLTNEKPIFVFVHVYKTAGSTIRSFFQEFAYLCKKSWMLVVGCTGVRLSSITANDRNWEKCRLKMVLDRDRVYEHDAMAERIYPNVNNTILKDSIDVLGGHLRIGTADYIFPTSSGKHNTIMINSPTTTALASIPPIRHIVFLRDPMERYVSGILYRAMQYDKIEVVTLEQTAALVKKRVNDARRHNEYLDNSIKYLLTPEQEKSFDNIKHDMVNKQLASAPSAANNKMRSSLLYNSERLAERKARMAIDNLFNYNAIVGMTERMTQSMEMLQHVLVNRYESKARKDNAECLFERYAPSDASSNEKKNCFIAKTDRVDDEHNREIEGEDGSDEDTSLGVVKNASQQGSVSTTSVLKELQKDEDFTRRFQEYVKYEQMIVDFAWEMHFLQWEMVLESRGIAGSAQSRK